MGILSWFKNRDHRYTAAQFVLIVLLVIFVWTALSQNSARDVDFGVLNARAASMPGVNALQPGNANDLQKVLGLDAAGLTDWLFYTADSLMDVTELLIVRAPDAEVRADVRDRVDARLAAQMDSFRDYGTNQYGLLEDAVIIERGAYLFYAVSENVDVWSDNFISWIS